MRHDNDMDCPVCGAPCDYDEVDIGVGVQTGNYRCEACGWCPPSVDDDVDGTTQEGSQKWPTSK